MTLHKARLAFVFAFSLVAINLTGAQVAPSSPLQLAVVPVQSTSGQPLFRVEMHNQGDHPLILNMGFMLANGEKQCPDAIHLFLKDSSGKTLLLEPKELVVIAGRVDPLIVPLPEGAIFVLPIDLQNYSSPKEKIWELNLSPGQYMLTAEYKGTTVSQQEANLDVKGIALMPYWTGVVQSNTLAFTLSKPMGRQQKQ
jgi:hypothetical protein